MKKLALLAIAGLLGACTSTAYQETPSEVRIAFGGGGLVYPIFDRYDAWEDQGKKIVIDGQVISADAVVSEFEVSAGAVPFLSDAAPFLSYSGGLPFTVTGAIVSTASIEANLGTGWRLLMDTVEIKV